MAPPVMISAEAPLTALNVIGPVVLKPAAGLPAGGEAPQSPTGGWVFTVITGATGVSIYDSNSLAGNIAANLIAVVPLNTTAVLNFPFKQGLLVTGAGPASIHFQ